MSVEHDWDDGKRFGYQVCRKCCAVKRLDGKNKPCRPARLREMELGLVDEDGHITPVDTSVLNELMMMKPATESPLTDAEEHCPCCGDNHSVDNCIVAQRDFLESAEHRIGLLTADLAAANATIEQLEQNDDCKGGVSGCRNMRKMCRTCQVEAIQSKLGAAVKVIERLPKTADGVPVTPGMEVWHCTQHHWKSKGSDEFAEMTEGIKAEFRTPYCCGRRCWDSGCQGDSGSGEHVKWSECYSTREAALLSKQEAKR